MESTPITGGGRKEGKMYVTSKVRFMSERNYTQHLYLDPSAMDVAKTIQKEQSVVDKMGTPRLIHPHPQDEHCGVLVHTGLVPYGDPEEVIVR